MSRQRLDGSLIDPQHRGAEQFFHLLEAMEGHTAGNSLNHGIEGYRPVSTFHDRTLYAGPARRGNLLGLLNAASEGPSIAAVVLSTHPRIPFLYGTGTEEKPAPPRTRRRGTGVPLRRAAVPAKARSAP